MGVRPHLATAFHVEIRSRRRTEHPYGGGLCGGCTCGEKETIDRRHEVGCARTGDGRDPCQAAVSGIMGVEDVDEALPTTGICPVTFCVDEHVVGIAAKIDAGDVASISSGERAESGRDTKCDEDPLLI